MTISTDIRQAVDAIKSGKIVAVPTETVYGLAVDPNNSEAVSQLFELKERQKNLPIAVLIKDNSQLTNWAIDIPDLAYELTEKFWPGPLTIVLKRASHVSKILTAKRNSIGLRSPKHNLTQEIIKQFGSGIAATSANFSGKKNLTTAGEIQNEFGDTVDLIIDGGQSEIGLASTVIDLTATPPKILREGSIHP